MENKLIRKISNASYRQGLKLATCQLTKCFIRDPLNVVWQEDQRRKRQLSKALQGGRSGAMLMLIPWLIGMIHKG
ncbi:unnamed protein product [Pseudo-nitzschia multistriata]|uniref:Uncharacterized protein n=1 Tax=Pseudo-nitzschia multistriata TaxID=183589 RepID=A0A448Z8E0_9STRA|nr:unnamed protein product [Pseudo-nitzschia multistriata]